MTNGKERSGIFKFFYVVLSVITFPFFVLIFLLKHPLGVLFFLFAVAGGMAYFPLSQNVEPAKIVDWYKEKYVEAKLYVVAEATKSGKADFIPKKMLEDAENIKKEMEDAVEEAKRPKGENYNVRIERDTKMEEVKSEMKKKKGGFRKAVNADTGKNAEIDAGEQLIDDEAKILEDSGTSGGGLAHLLKGISKDKATTEELSANVNNENIETSTDNVVVEDKVEKNIVMENNDKVETKDMNVSEKNMAEDAKAEDLKKDAIFDDDDFSDLQLF